MCLIKVNRIDRNTCLLNTVQRMVCSKNQLISIRLFTPPLNISGIGAVEPISITTVNVKHSDIINDFKKLFAELFCQENTRSDYNNPGRTITIKLCFGIFNHTNGLATTRRDDNLTFVVLLHRFQSVVLVGAKSDGHGCLLNLR